ncbi:MAG: hypothetical protein M3R65_09120, partial [Gemmatimonadota bacterium]|nr:hypothetical protein [Gemmatimonadota bacterium]
GFTVSAAPTQSAAQVANPPASDIAITLSDYAFTLSKPVTAGHHVFSVDNSASQPHEVQLVQLAPGKTAADVLRWLEKPGGPPPASAIGGVAPFSRTTNYFAADLTPGNYALICFVRDAKDGKPHFMHGMTSTLTVS